VSTAANDNQVQPGGRQEHDQSKVEHVRLHMRQAQDQARRDVAGYGGKGEQPLGPYLALAGIFNLGFAAFLVAAQRADRPLPDRLSARDVALLGVASFKLSRLISRDQVTAFLRAPFVTYKGPAAASEIEEEPRGEGWQRALGNLLTCPYCVAQWVSAGFAYGFILAPRTTRFAAGVFSAYALSDFVGFAYEIAMKNAQS
jgi:hypothetical protein